jgi:hypothetical protein
MDLLTRHDTQAILIIVQSSIELLQAQTVPARQDCLLWLPGMSNYDEHRERKIMSSCHDCEALRHMSENKEMLRWYEHVVHSKLGKQYKREINT